MSSESFVLTVACGNTVIVQVGQEKAENSLEIQTDGRSGEDGRRNISSRHRLITECVLSSNVACKPFCLLGRGETGLGRDGGSTLGSNFALLCFACRTLCLRPPAQPAFAQLACDSKASQQHYYSCLRYMQLPTLIAIPMQQSMS